MREVNTHGTKLPKQQFQRATIRWMPNRPGTKWLSGKSRSPIPLRTMLTQKIDVILGFGARDRGTHVRVVDKPSDSDPELDKDNPAPTALAAFDLFSGKNKGDEHSFGRIRGLYRSEIRQKGGLGRRRRG